MLTTEELILQDEQTASLCGKAEKIDVDIPSDNVTLEFDYAAYESTKDITQSNAILSVINQNTALSLQRKQVSKELAAFMHENSSLAADPRFSDAYHFRLSLFYEQLEDFEKQNEALQKIQNKELPDFAEKIAEAKIRLNENSKENLAVLYKLNTDSSIRKLSGYYLAEHDFDNAEKALNHYLEEHDEVPYEIYFQFAYIYLNKHDLNRAVHFLRKAFFTRPTAQAATVLSFTYLIKSIKEKHLFTKALYWCSVATEIDKTFTPALSLFVNLNLEKDEASTILTEKKLERYLSLPSARQSESYFDAQINYAKCAFNKKRYGECLERLQVLTEEETRQSAVWNNIALCNEALQKYDRAEKNIKKSLEKFQAKKSLPQNRQREKNDFDRNSVLETILTNYMRILNKQKKYAETLTLFETCNGAKDFVLSERSYLNYFSQIRTALLESGKLEDYFTFLNTAFLYDTNDLQVKIFAANDLLKLCTTFNIRPEQTKACLDFLKNAYYKEPASPQMKKQLNNIVFTCLEIGEDVPSDILQPFISTIGKNPFATATFGLYQFKIKHNLERGAYYYDKAIALARESGESSNTIEEIKLKKDIEHARALLLQGDRRTSARLLERCRKASGGLLEGYRQKAESLLAECRL